MQVWRPESDPQKPCEKVRICGGTYNLNAREAETGRNLGELWAACLAVRKPVPKTKVDDT